MWRLGPAWQDEVGLARAWAEARPFAHLVVDDFAPEDRLEDLLALLEEEPIQRYEGEIFGFDASAPEPVTAELVGLRAELAEVLCPPLARITGQAVGRVDMRAYAYRVGDYLLPHSDCQDDLGRALAYAYYLPSPSPPEGGELELYACEVADGALVSTVSAKRIAPAANRLVVFEVSPRSLHQVREVLGGLRISLAGWFYP